MLVFVTTSYCVPLKVKWQKPFQDAQISRKHALPASLFGILPDFAVTLLQPALLVKNNHHVLHTLSHEKRRLLYFVGVASHNKTIDRCNSFRNTSLGRAVVKGDSTKSFIAIAQAIRQIEKGFTTITRG